MVEVAIFMFMYFTAIKLKEWQTPILKFFPHFLKSNTTASQNVT